MDAGGAGLEAHAVFAPLPHDLRLRQGQLPRVGEDHAVALFPHLPQGGAHPLVFPSHLGHVGEQGHQVPVPGDGDAAFFAEGPVKELPGQHQAQGGPADVRPHLRDACRFHDGDGGDPLRRVLRVPQAGHVGAGLLQGPVQLRLQGMLRLQGVQPVGQEDTHFRQGEFLERSPDDGSHVLCLQVQAGNEHAVHVVFLLQFRPQGLGLRTLRPGGIQHQDEGLAQGLQLPHGALLRGDVSLSGDLRDAAVGGHDDADGGVLRDHLPRAGLRRLRHGDLVVEPVGGHHPGRALLLRSGGPFHQISHAVDETDGEPGPARGDLHRLLRHEFRFAGHDRPTGAALGQLVSGPLPAVHVLDAGEHQGLHEALDEGGFAGAHRPHHADIDVAARANGYVLINGMHIQERSLRFCAGEPGFQPSTASAYAPFRMVRTVKTAALKENDLGQDAKMTNFRGKMCAGRLAIFTLWLYNTSVSNL